MLYYTIQYAAAGLYAVVVDGQRIGYAETYGHGEYLALEWCKLLQIRRKVFQSVNATL